MTTMQTFAPTEKDIETARKVRSRLAEKRHVLIEITISGESLPLSEGFAEAIYKALAEVAKGRRLAIVPDEDEVSPNEAARILNVSRPFLIGLLDKGEIPFRKVGSSHRRIPLADLLAYKEKTRARSRKLLADLTTEAQESGLDYQGDE
jgi:excisionase family DNA binding protein